MSGNTLGDIGMSEGSDNQILLVRIEGKLDRISDRLDRYDQDMASVKARLHDFGNHLQGINALNLSKHITEQDTCNASMNARVTALEADAERRKGAMGLAKVLWMIFGGLTVGGAALVIRVVAAGVN